MNWLDRNGVRVNVRSCSIAHWFLRGGGDALKTFQSGNTLEFVMRFNKWLCIHSTITNLTKIAGIGVFRISSAVLAQTPKCLWALLHSTGFIRLFMYIFLGMWVSSASWLAVCISYGMGVCLQSLVVCVCAICIPSKQFLTATPNKPEKIGLIENRPDKTFSLKCFILLSLVCNIG